MKISEYLSWKFKVLSFFAMILVLYSHAYMPDAAQFTTFYVVEKGWAFYWGRLFFPLFFFMSGYLFYIQLNSPDWSVWVQKYKSRIKSLLIPYVIWNILCLLQMFALKYNALTGRYINSDYSQLFESGIGRWLYELFVVPGGFHLWFIRDLILIVAVSPLIYWIIKKAWFIYFPVIIYFSFYNAWCQSLTMFSAGAVFAIYNFSLEHKIDRWKLIILAAASAVMTIYCSTIFLPDTKVLYSVWILLLFVWFLYDYLYEKGFHFTFMERWVSYTFFIYLVHIPALNIFKKLLMLAGNGAEWSYWLCFIVTPILMAFIAIYIGHFFRVYFPKIYSVLTGGR